MTFQQVGDFACVFGFLEEKASLRGILNGRKRLQCARHKLNILGNEFHVPIGPFRQRGRVEQRSTDIAVNLPVSGEVRELRI